MDVVAYSTVTDALQVAIKTRLNGFITDAVERIAVSERIILDTGDGVAMCFLGDPEDALFVATSVKDAAAEDMAAGHAHAPILRIGINLGPVKLVTDLNGQPNVLGDGINVAQRVMTFAEEHEILVSRSYYEVVARLRAGNEKLFSYLGARKDKHVREHQLYAFGLRGPDVAFAADQHAASDQRDDPGGGALNPDVLAEAERRLAERIGPLARIIVRRAGLSSVTIRQLYDSIATAIPDEADRASFLDGMPRDQAAPAAPDKSSRVGQKEGGGVGATLSEEDLTLATQRMAQLMGPLAHLLVRKAAARALSKADLYELLADNIDDADKRAEFLNTAAAELTATPDRLRH